MIIHNISIMDGVRLKTLGSVVPREKARSIPFLPRGFLGVLVSRNKAAMRFIGQVSASRELKRTEVYSKLEGGEGKSH